MRFNAGEVSPVVGVLETQEQRQDPTGTQSSEPFPVRRLAAGFSREMRSFLSFTVLLST